MNSICNQKGASIIAVIAVMLILAVMGTTLISLVTTGSDVSVNQLQSEQALNVAEGGAEYAIRQLKDSPGYAGGAGISLGSGTFDITVSGPAGGSQTITSTSYVSNAQRVIEIETQGGNAITNGTFTSDISGWTETLTNTDGSSAWSNYPIPPGGSPGSLLSQTNTGRGLNFTGYRSQGISIASGASVTFNIDYCKNATSDTGGNSRMDTSVVIVYQGGATYTVWSDTSQPITACSDEANWPATVNTSFTTTNNVIEVRIVYDLRNRSGPSGDGTKKEVWFDTVSLSTSFTVVSRSEVY